MITYLYTAKKHIPVENCDKEGLFLKQDCKEICDCIVYTFDADKWRFIFKLTFRNDKDLLMFKLKYEFPDHVDTSYERMVNN